MGMLVELVAKPMPKQSASSLPTNLATRPSSSSWILFVPARAPGGRREHACMRIDGLLVGGGVVFFHLSNFSSREGKTARPETKTKKKTRFFPTTRTELCA
jgi:hypothetical protein